MSAEHSDRRNHHRQPRRPDANHWGKDGSRHDGIDPGACPICRFINATPKETSA